MVKKEEEETKNFSIQEKIKSICSKIEKDFGKGTFISFDDEHITKVDFIPTGSLSLDRALYIGGIPRGRIIEIFGQEMVGKTSLTLHIIAEAQKRGLLCAFIDAEHAFNKQFAESIGVNVEELLLNQPDSGEQALQIVEDLVQSGEVALIVVDSVAALVPEKELKGEIGDAHVGLQARMIGQAIRKLTGVCARTNTSIIFINQLRMKIGVMYGNPYDTPGGKSLKFAASVRLDTRKSGSIKKGNDIIGNRVKVKVVKNKLAPPFKVAEFDFLFDSGIDKIGEIVELGVNLGIIDKAGAWFSYKTERIGQGIDNVKEFFKNQPELLKEVSDRVYENMATVTCSSED